MARLGQPRQWQRQQQRLRLQRLLPPLPLLLLLPTPQPRVGQQRAASKGFKKSFEWWYNGKVNSIGYSVRHS